MQCWICGADNAQTHEHKGKASDLRSLFGSVTQKKPLYLHTAKRLNKPIGGIKADALKYEHCICEGCNSAVTQPYDIAWEHCSEALRTRNPLPEPAQRLRFSRIFPYDTRRWLLYVHLYFVKHCGCQIVEGKIPLDTAPFSKALLEGRAHPNLYLVFGKALDGFGAAVSGTDVHAKLFEDGGLAVASYMYEVGSLCVNVMYAADGEHPDGLKHAWHPRLGTTRIDFVSFEAG